MWATFTHVRELFRVKNMSHVHSRSRADHSSSRYVFRIKQKILLKDKTKFLTQGWNIFFKLGEYKISDSRMKHIFNLLFLGYCVNEKWTWNEREREQKSEPRSLTFVNENLPKIWAKNEPRSWVNWNERRSRSLLPISANSMIQIESLVTRDRHRFNSI